MRYFSSLEQLISNISSPIALMLYLFMQAYLLPAMYLYGDICVIRLVVTHCCTLKQKTDTRTKENGS